MSNPNLNSEIFEGDRLINHQKLESWLQRHVRMIEEPQEVTVVKSPYEPEKSKALSLHDLKGEATQALIDGVGVHPQCDVINPATVLALAARIEKAEKEAHSLRQLLGRSGSLEGLHLQVDEQYKQGFIDGKEFQVDKNRSAPLPLAWLIVDDLTRKARLTFTKPTRLEHKHCHAQALYARGD